MAANCTTINRLRIDGRLHSVGDTVFIPVLGYKGTILNLQKRQLDGVEEYLILTLPHDYGEPIIYTPSDLRAGVGVSTHMMRHFESHNVFYDASVQIFGFPTYIHQSRSHYAECMEPYASE